MLTFWNITADKLNELEISQTEQKVIFVSDTERLYVDFNGVRTEYRNIIYVQNINNITPTDENKNSIYFEISTKKLYYYFDNEYFLLNPDAEGFVYIGRYTADGPITSTVLDTFVNHKKGRDAQVNDMIIDKDMKQWLKIDNKGDENDWVCLNQQILASFESFGLVKIKQNSGLKIENGILSLNILDEDRVPGQIVILNDKGKIDSDIINSKDFELEWHAI